MQEAVDKTASSADEPQDALVGHTTDHESWIDWARALCALAVVFLHVWDSVTANLPAAEVGVTRLSIWTGLQIVGGRFAVPVFFMITGYLLLNRKKVIAPASYRRYIVRMAIVLCTLGLLFCLMEAAYLQQAVTGETVVAAVAALLEGRSWDHMWYVYVMLGVYLVLPVFKRFSDGVSQGEWKGVLAALFVAALVLPTALGLAGLEVTLTPFTKRAASGVFYLLLGGYVGNFVHEKTDRVGILGIAGAAGAIVLAVAFVPRALEGSLQYKLAEVPESPLIALWAYAVFTWFRFGPLAGRRPGALVLSLAACSFGIYLFNPLAYNLIFRVFATPALALTSGMSLLVFLAAALSSWCLTFLLRLVPPVRKIL